jgi:trimethylamine---corrinoid protein Co-methyltransferase
MLHAPDVAQLEDKVFELLRDVGILVENDAMTEMCLRKGCKAGADHRVRIPRELVDEMVAFLRPSQAEYERNHELVYCCGPDWHHYLVWSGQVEQFRERYKTEFLMQAFDCGPTTYYDHRQNAIKPVDDAIFDTMMKFAEATPEIGYTSMWYRQDMPPMIERLDSLRRSMDLTSKFTGIEAIHPEVIKYLKEASAILTGDPDSSAFLAGSECMTPPLILDKRSAEDILARAEAGVHRYHVASMPTLGVSTPVTLAGAIVMGAAEILGGMAICWCVDPESDISGRMIPNIVDMRNGNATTFGPIFVQYGNAVRQLFNESWGGHCMVEVCFSVTAQRPGIQALFENSLITSLRQQWDGRPDIPYAGMGTLHNGALGSPTQFMLDMEMREAQWLQGRGIEVSDDTLNFDEVLAVTRERGNFLTSPHTMTHYHGLWTSDCLRSDSPFGGGPWDGTEKAMLDACDAKWRANLDQWEPPEWPEDTTKAIDAVVSRARKEFGIPAQD